MGQNNTQDLCAGALVAAGVGSGSARDAVGAGAGAGAAAAEGTGAAGLSSSVFPKTSRRTKNITTTLKTRSAPIKEINAFLLN